MQLSKVTPLLILGMGIAAAQPSISSVTNAASNILQGLPNSGVAPGSIFVVKGTGLGPATLTTAPAAFQSANLAGTSISVTVGTATVSPLMYYTSAGQLAALLPSNTPTGAANLIVTYQGSASTAFAVQVVANNIGIFSVTQDGQGVAIATYPDYSLVSAVPGTGTLGGGGPNTYSGAAHPGDVLTLWATGLGAVSGGDSTASLGQTVSVPLTLWIGGVSVPVSYQGRSGCCVGEDQIQFTVPNNVITGCAVPLILQIGTLVSNTTVMPFTTSGRSCTPQNPALTSAVVQSLTTATGPINFASLQLGRQLFSVSSSGSFYDDYAQTSFGQVSVSYNNQPTQPIVLTSFDNPPAGTCMAFSAASTGNPTLVTPLAGADPGGVTVAGPNGQLSLTDRGGTPTVFASVLSGQGTYFSGGNYTVSAPGGRDIGAFATKFTIVATPTWTGGDQNRLATTGVTRASGMTINWTPGTAAGSGVYNVVIRGTSYTDGTGQNGATFLCLVPSTLGTFTVPPSVLYALPSGPFTEVDFEPALPSQSFTATGLDVGILSFHYQTSVFPMFD